MKKSVLIGIVVLGFIAYSWQQRSHPAAAITAPATPGSRSSTPAAAPATPYKDGRYTGSAADAYYGNIQVQVSISAGKIADVLFLQYPNDRDNSIAINQQAMPLLRQEAIAAQSAQVDVVSGATDTSNAFVTSLASALAQAKA